MGYREASVARLFEAISVEAQPLGEGSFSQRLSSSRLFSSRPVMEKCASRVDKKRSLLTKLDFLVFDSITRSSQIA